MSREALVEEILSRPKRLEDPRKRAAITTNSRFVRVIAGAGAGKTETLTRRIVYLLLVEKVPPSQIVAFTFTDKAAAAMKERIYERVGLLAGEEMVAHLGEMFIGTIHAFAKRLLEEKFGFGIHTLLDENQEMAFLLREGWGLSVRDFEQNYTDACRIFLRTSSMVLDELLDQKVLEKEAPDFFHKFERYSETLEKHKLLTFGRVMHEVVMKLRTDANPVSDIRYLIVDEYQDINKAQAELIGIIGKTASVFVVGDPRQSIYQWRGSNESFFEEFEKTFPGCESFSINENHRSRKRIVDAANRFANSFERGKFESLNPVLKEDGFVGLVNCANPDMEAAWIASQIEQLVKKGSHFSDIGVLTRSVNTSAPKLLAEFNARRIPYIVGGKVGLFKRPEAIALGQIFSWLYEDGFWGFGDAQIRGDDLLTAAATNWESAIHGRLPDDFREKMDSIKGRLASSKSKFYNFTQIFQAVLEALGFPDLDPNDSGLSPVLANLGRFNGLLTDYETANRLGGKSPRWQTHLKGLMWFIMSFAVGSYEEQQDADLKGVDAVQVMTVHQAKGLEWPIVFLFATNHNRFPSKNVGKVLNWCCLPRTLFDAERYESTTEDEKRLFYVAITRAMDALIVSHFDAISRSIPRSEFIDALEGENVVSLSGPTFLPNLDVRVRPEPDEMHTHSATEVISYLRCPYQYLMRYEWGFQPGLNHALGYGKALHFCLSKTNDFVKNGLNPVSAVAEAVDKYFFMPFAGGQVLEDFKVRAREDLVRFVRKYGNDMEKIKETEYRIEFPVERATVTGKVDVILQDHDELEVRDYKTNEEATTQEESALQVRLYTNGLRNRGEPVTRGSVAYLEDPEIRPVEVQEVQLKQSLDRAGDAVRGIHADKRFNGRCGTHCENCDFREICIYLKRENNGQ